ncbi:hypothetical protein [Mesorhizobium sp. M1163]|uniref:hypothetical protein n=1 Tax=Mesorhizobium sp. M1163 TaxID=2957065 RepID=UPI00333B82A1
MLEVNAKVFVEERLQDLLRQSRQALRQAGMSGERLSDARTGFDLKTNAPILLFRFDSAGKLSRFVISDASKLSRGVLGAYRELGEEKGIQIDAVFGPPGRALSAPWVSVPEASHPSGAPDSKTGSGAR